MSYTSVMRNLLKDQRGQAMVEAAVAIPIALLLFAGCIQFVQIGLAHIVVMEAAYEAGRQASLDQDQTGNAQRVAAEICRSLSSGTTVFQIDRGQYAVTHHLNSIFPILKNITVSHSCPQTLFLTADLQGGNDSE